MKKHPSNKNYWEQPEKQNFVLHIKSCRKILNLFPEDRNINILDVGCGNGKFHTLLKEQGYKNVVGLDFTKNSIAQAKKINPCYRYEVFDISDTSKHFPFENNVFDLVLCTWVLEHVMSPYHIIEEILRVSKPSGYGVIATHNGLRYEVFSYRKHSKNRIIPIPSCQYLTPAVLESIIRRLGGSIIYSDWRAKFFLANGIYIKFKKI